MLYIFHVDTGTLMKFDIKLAFERVSKLQAVIAKMYHIPEDKQVFLISGGESLHSNDAVGKSHAGTDSNPIFLFDKSIIENRVPPSLSVNHVSDAEDLQYQAEESLLMPSVYQTVMSRAQLALQFHKVDTEELQACENLIRDQHLQQQGWALVITNLEDVTIDLQRKSNKFYVTFHDYLESRASYKELIASVTGSLQVLSKIPLTLALAKSYDATASISSNETLPNSTLFDWISSKDSDHTLHEMVEQCDKAIEQLDENVEESLKTKVEQILKEVHNNQGMKEILGVEDRLFGLDQIICGARKLVEEQRDLAKGFEQNQTRYSKEYDPVVLSDLCASHRTQLAKMLKIHSRLQDIKKKCHSSKEELSFNIHSRLGWVMYVQRKILNVDSQLTICLGNIRRIKKRLAILQQINDAPRVYAQLLVEVVRRRNFSSKFLMWAGGVADISGRLHTEEVKRRDTFRSIIGQHFLQSMFCGLEDMPSAFANKPPELFDKNLPDISVEDIQQLQVAIPELSGILSVPIDEDPFTAVSTITDSKVSSTIPPCVRSEISESDELNQRYCAEDCSISLRDQFTLCVQDPGLVSRPICCSFVSPPDNFLLVKSLSKELTKQLSNIKKNVHEGETVETKLKAQPLQATRSTSAAEAKYLLVSHSSKMSPASTSETCYPPDMKRSQELATAELYFNDEMSSSLESFPKSSTKTKATFEDKFLVEKESNAKLQSELHECVKKINHYEKIFKHFKSLFDNAVPDLKTIAKELKIQHCDQINILMNKFESLRENMKWSLHSYEATISRSYGNLIDQMNSERAKQIQELNNKIAVESLKSKEFEVKVKMLSEKIKKLGTSHQKDVERIMREKDELGAKLAVELADLTIKHELELEIEVDEVKAEYLTKMAVFEKDLEYKDKLISNKDSSIRNLQEEKTKIAQQLMNKFQMEKDKLYDMLSIDFNEKLQKAVKKEQNKAECMKHKIKTELNEEHKKCLQKQLEELKQSLLVETEQAVQMSEKLLTFAHEKFAKEMQQRLLDEKSIEFKKLKEELENKFQAALENNNKESNKVIEGLVAELKTFKDKQFTCSEMQTQQSVDNMIDCGIQVGSNYVMVDAQVATEILLAHTSTFVQTEFQNGISVAIETDESCLIQTGNGHLVIDCSLQTHDVHVSYSESGVQTDQQEVDLSSMAKSEALDTEVNMKFCLDFDKIIYNEAVKKVCKEKDKLIDDLKMKEKELADQLSMLKDQVEHLKEEKQQAESAVEMEKSSFEAREKEFTARKQQFEIDLGLQQQHLKQCNEKLQNLTPEVRDSSSSTSFFQISGGEDSMFHTGICDLEEEVKMKGEELSKMPQKMIKLQMSASNRSLVQDKVSITSCCAGDLVLLYLDQQLDQYVVYTICSTIHFLRNDCLIQLGLIPEAGQAKRQWLIVEVVDKEICQARRENNRFNVPLGTKFYRVRARIWKRQSMEATIDGSVNV